MSFECPKERVEQLFIMLPSSHASGMSGLASLHHARGPHDAASRVEVQAGRVPVKPQKLDELPRVPMDVPDEFFVADFEPRNRSGTAPVIEKTLMIRESPRDVLEIVRPRNRRETSLPA